MNPCGTQQGGRGEKNPNRKPTKPDAKAKYTDLIQLELKKALFKCDGCGLSFCWIINREDKPRGYVDYYEIKSFFIQNDKIHVKLDPYIINEKFSYSNGFSDEFIITLEKIVEVECPICNCIDE